MATKMVLFSWQLICCLKFSPAVSIISDPIVFLSPFHPLNEANGAARQIVGEFLVSCRVSCWAVSVDSRQEVGSWITSHPAQPFAMLQPVTDVQPRKLERVLQNENKRKFSPLQMREVHYYWPPDIIGQ